MSSETAPPVANETPTGWQDSGQGTSLAYLHEQAANSPVTESLEQLPPYIARGVVYLVLAFLVVCVIYSVVGRIDIVREAPAVVVPEGHLKSIQSDCDGIVAEIRFKEGDVVNEGDELAMIDSREVAILSATLEAADWKRAEVEKERSETLPLQQDQIESQQLVLQKKREGLEAERLNIERKIDDLRQNRLLSEETRALEQEREVEEATRLQLEQENAEGTFKLWERELAVNQRLRKRGVVSDLQLLAVERSRDQAEAAVKKNASLREDAQQSWQIAAKKFEALLLLNQQSHEDLEEQSRQNALALKSVELELKQKQDALELLDREAQSRRDEAAFEESQAEQAMKLRFPGIDEEHLGRMLRERERATNKTTLRAPVDGRIGKVLVRHPGEAVTRGQVVMTLIPVDMPLVMEIRIAHRDVGMVDVGMPVKFKFDAFPHVEHGVIDGVLTDIVPEAEGLVQGSGAPGFYRAYGTLQQEYFIVKDRQAPLLPGMSATAEIITEDKSLLSLLLTPLEEYRKSRSAQK
ncbi:MAG: HlyD family efflux transporter periplasmic adaptor subunit [Planctomycetales bacterium]